MRQAAINIDILKLLKRYLNLNRGKDMIKALLIIFMLTFPLSGFAMLQSGETVTQRAVVNDDLYAAGGTVDIDAVVSGDVVAAGGDLFIANQIKGDVNVAGGSVHIRGDVQDDVRSAGGEITVDATVADDLIAAGGKINVSAASTVGGDAWLAGGDVHVAGTINKNLLVAAGNVRLSGITRGDVIIEGGEIQILEGAIIDGDLHYKSPNQAKIHSTATIAGKVTYEQVEWDGDDRGEGLFFVITMVVASVVLFKLFPGFTLSAVARISADPLKSLGAGLLALIVIPVIAVLLISIILGIWVGLSLLALYFVALLLGFLVACFFVGDRGARLFNKEVDTSRRRLLFTSIAIIALGLIKLIPVIGGLLLFTLLLSGLGAVIMQLKDIFNQSEIT